jgi:hypothetical protein
MQKIKKPHLSGYFFISPLARNHKKIHILNIPRQINSFKEKFPTPDEDEFSIKEFAKFGKKNFISTGKIFQL